MAKNKDKTPEDDTAPAKDKVKAKKGKEKSKGKGKGKADRAPYSSIATHPRAHSSVRLAKGWAGLAGFALAAVLSLKASVPVVEVGGRALVAGIVGYMLAWWVSVLVWRQLIIAEQRAVLEEIKRRRDEDTDAGGKGGKAGKPEAQPTG